MCTLYNGVPYGPASIQLIHPKGKDYGSSFEGVGLFADGKLQGPFTCMRGDGISMSFRKMQNGRPADGDFGTEFYPEGDTEYVNSLTEMSDVSGWQYYSGQF
jgi:hypothetical protein